MQVQQGDRGMMVSGDRERRCSPVRGGEVIAPLGTQGEESRGSEFRMRSRERRGGEEIQEFSVDENETGRSLLYERLLGAQPGGSCRSSDK